MKQLTFFLTFTLFYFCINGTHAQSQWAWIGGDTISPTASYGTQGVANALNKPAATYEGARWTDLQGNLWIYGEGHTDMWKYNPYANMWTWMGGSQGVIMAPNYGIKGVAAATNSPGARHFCPATWTDHNGDLWLFGGETNIDNAKRADLWRYNIATNMWTWVSGTNMTNSAGNFGIKGVPSISNVPPSRTETAAQWTDAVNNLWIFGGLGVAQLDHDDLWRYNITSNEWTWVSGTSTGNNAGVYGSKGVANATNRPGGRAVYTPWKDLSGNFYLFGGFTNAQYSNYNDVWKYDATANMWTWVNGASTVQQTGNYGTQCTPDTIHYPYARHENRATWTFGDNFIVSRGTDIAHGFFNDTWNYNAACNEWTWMHGSTNANTAAVFGVKGIPSVNNTPIADFGNFAFKDTLGRCFYFGGWSGGNLLWQFYPDTACWSSSPCINSGAAPIVNFAASDSLWCEKDCINFTDLSTNSPTTWSWNFGGANPDTSTAQHPQGICFNSYGMYDVQLIACNTVGCDTLSIPNFITVLQSPPIPTITFSNDTLYSSPAYAYQWYNIPLPIPGAVLPYYYVTAQGSYYVLVFDSNGCFSASPTFNYTNFSESENTHGYVSPIPVVDNLTIYLGAIGNAANLVTVTIYDITGKKMTNHAFDNLTNATVTIPFENYAAGIYSIRVVVGSRLQHYKVIKQ